MRRGASIGIQIKFSEIMDPVTNRSAALSESLQIDASPTPRVNALQMEGWYLSRGMGFGMFGHLFIYSESIKLKFFGIE
ncbi:hypothetical protein TNCT_646151 [Trichonephila clavata]|uniref:Uncharacterized protein n=1 Tax=Trichonephila clavata TaxID=2740835 RepID=A0A8X6HGM0_TRICU|nr:hypothetical protein TNCT_646151 [Trichonephila clavata]